MSIDLEKERNNFEEDMSNSNISLLRMINGKYESDYSSTLFYGWVSCAKSKNLEISNLKRQIRELQKTNQALMEYKDKIDNLNYALVPRAPTQKMLDSGYEKITCYHNCIYDELIDAYKSMIEESQEK